MPPNIRSLRVGTAIPHFNDASRGCKGEGSESGLINDIERFFARYQPAELTTMLEQAGFSVRERRSDDVGSRRWLTMLATRS